MSPLKALPELSQRRTTSDEVTETLREAISGGQFTDGEELNQVELARHFGVSRVPVREALRRLQAEGLVSAEAHRRVVVPTLSPDRIGEIFEVRALLEAHMLERAAKELSKDDLAKLEPLIGSMDRVKSRDAWLEKNHAFHRGLLAPADAPITMTLVEQLSHQVERYMHRLGGVHRPKEAGHEHRQILAALKRGATKEATNLLRRHILGTRDAVLSSLPDSKDTDEVGTD